MWVNQIYLGRGAYGVAAASLEYFDKSIKELDYAEAALLAALPKAPSKYNPYKNLELAKEFYTNILGCTIGRSSDNWIDFNLFGHQVVAHLSPDELSKNNYFDTYASYQF